MRVPRAVPASALLQGPWCPLTLDVPGPPDGVVEADLVPAQQLEAFEILPLGRNQLATVRGRGLGQGWEAVEQRGMCTAEAAAWKSPGRSWRMMMNHRSRLSEPL